MKKAISILSVLALTLVFSGISFAQTQSVTATATVDSEISLTKNSDIAFGTISQNVTATLDPNGSNQNVGGGAGIGDIDISASSSTGITVSWNNDALLTDSDNTASMGLTADVDGSTTNNDAANSSDISNGGNVTTDGSGNFYLYIGGSITAAASQETDSYSTGNTGGKALTIEVNYQ